MGRCRTVKPETIQIPISDGDYIVVKKRLNYGESTKAKATIVKDFHADGRVTPDFEVVEIAQVLAYLVEWSLVDEHGQQIPIDTHQKRLAAINAQDTATIRELIDAVDAHVKAMDEERAAEKNVTAGETASPATSLSVV